MTTAQLIAALAAADPAGTAQVDLYITRRRGFYQRPALTVRRFLESGNVKITDEPSPPQEPSAS